MKGDSPWVVGESNKHHLRQESGGEESEETKMASDPFPFRDSARCCFASRCHIAGGRLRKEEEEEEEIQHLHWICEIMAGERKKEGGDNAFFTENSL